MIHFNKAFEKFYFNFYISTISSGQRKLGMLGFFSRAKIEDCWARAKRGGLATRVQKADYDDPSGEWLLYFSKSSDILRQALKLSHSKDQEWEKKNRELGALYGYPKCCIDFFINLNDTLTLDERKEFNYLKKAVDNSSLNKFPFLTNRFTLNPFIFHVPCSFYCKETIRLTRGYIKIAKKINPSITRQILKNLKATVLITDDSAVSIPGYKLKEDKIFFKGEDFKKALLLEEKIREYLYKLTSNKKNFDFYFSKREMSRMREEKWKKVLGRFESGGEYKISVTNCKDVKVILFE